MEKHGNKRVNETYEPFLPNDRAKPSSESHADNRISWIKVNFDFLML